MHIGCDFLNKEHWHWYRLFILMIFCTFCPCRISLHLLISDLLCLNCIHQRLWHWPINQDSTRKHFLLPFTLEVMFICRSLLFCVCHSLLYLHLCPWCRMGLDDGALFLTTSFARHHSHPSCNPAVLYCRCIFFTKQ